MGRRCMGTHQGREKGEEEGKGVGRNLIRSGASIERHRVRGVGMEGSRIELVTVITAHPLTSHALSVPFNSRYYWACILLPVSHSSVGEGGGDFKHRSLSAVSR